MLTAMPTKTAVCRTRTLTPSVTIGSSSKELLDETVPDRGDHVSAGEHRAIGWRTGIDRLENLSRRRVFHLRDSIPRIAVPHGRTDERFRVPTRHDHGPELQLPDHHAGEFEAPGRAVLPAVEQSDDRPAVQFLSTDQLALKFEQGIDIVHAERANERVRSRPALPLEEADRPIVRRRMQHPVEGALPVEPQEVAYAEGDGHAFDHDRLGVLFRRQADNFLLLPQIRGRRRRTVDDLLAPRRVDEDRHLSGCLDDDPESVRAEGGPDEAARPGFPAAAVHMNPNGNRLQAVRMAPPLAVPAETNDRPRRGDTHEKGSPSPERDEAAPARGRNGLG